jgi:PAS domain S-box-containing protein
MASIARLDNRASSVTKTDLLLAAFEYSSQALAIVEDGTILHANAAFADRFGLSSSELEGTALAGVLSDLPQEETPTAIREIRAVGPDGVPQVFELSQSNVTLGQRHLWVVALHDANERRRAEQNERQEFHDREIALRLTHRLAQDLNSLLSGITLCSDVVAEGLEMGRRPRLHVEKIRTASRRGEELVHQVLALVGPVHQPPAALPKGDAPGCPPPGVPPPAIAELKKR